MNECKPEERVKAQKVLDKFQSGLSENRVFEEIRKICQHDLNSSLNFSAIHSMDCEHFFARFRLRFFAPHITKAIKMITACTAAFRFEMISKR